MYFSPPHASLSVIPFVYLESWMFTVPGVALGWITVINTILVMFPFSIVFIFEAMNDQVTRDILDNVFLVFPQYDISMGLFSAFMREGLQSEYYIQAGYLLKMGASMHNVLLLLGQVNNTASFK